MLREAVTTVLQDSLSTFDCRGCRLIRARGRRCGRNVAALKPVQRRVTHHVALGRIEQCDPVFAERDYRDIDQRAGRHADLGEPVGPYRLNTNPWPVGRGITR